MLTYACLFFASLIGSVVLTPVVRGFAHARGWVSQPGSARDLHSRPVPRLGGVALFVTIAGVIGGGGMVCASLGYFWPVSARAVLQVLAPAFMIFVVGLIDDFYRLKPHAKLAGQVLAALLLCAAGAGIHSLPWAGAAHPVPAIIGVPLTVFWVVLITNAFNLIDGMDGLMVGSAAFSTVVLFVLSVLMGDQVTALMTVAMLGTLLGFLRYNFSPATIFPGDSGSLLVGFLLAGLGLAQSQKATTAGAAIIPVVAFGLPILDVGITLLRRFLGGKPLFLADGDHIHHKLLKRGLSPRTAVLILYGVSVSFAGLSMLLYESALWRTGVVLSLLGAGMFAGIRQLRYVEFLELLRAVRRTLDEKKIIANNLGVRRAVHQLAGCAGLTEIATILMQTFEPIGFQGIVLQGRNQGSSPDSLNTPFTRAPGGALRFFWATPEREAPCPSWSLGFELVTAARQRWGSVTLIHGDGPAPLLMDPTLFAAGFSTALADALQRVSAPLEKLNVPQLPLIPATPPPARLRVVRPQWRPGISSPQS